VSALSRKEWRDGHFENAASLSLYANMPLPQALDTPQSVAALFFESKTYKGFMKDREAENKMQAEIIGRLNTVVKAINVLIKSSR
jgi:hypothetical protein